MKKRLILLFLCLFLPNLLWAGEIPSKIFIASDFHLFVPGFDFSTIEDQQKRESAEVFARANQSAWENMLNVIKNDPAITSVILNGDLYDAFRCPLLASMDDERRIELMIDLLVSTQKFIKKPIYFNIGNHDLKATVNKDLTIVVDPHFPIVFGNRFKEAIEKQERLTGIKLPIHFIGIDQPGFGDFKSVFDVKIDGKKMKLSHAPFVKTEAIVDQAEIFKSSNPRAYKKVTLQPLLETNNSDYFYLFGDTHTPAQDSQLRVYNSGALAVDRSLPYKAPTFMILEGNQAQHYTFDPKNPNKLIKYEVPNSGFYCRRFYGL